MSWKLLVSAGLLCIVVSPAMAVPTASATLTGLDANGNWVWTVGVTPDTTLFAAQAGQGTGGSVAIEIGATATQRNIVSVASNATNFPNNNVGGAIPGTFPTPTGTGFTGNNAVANLGSDFFTTGGLKSAFTVTVQRPTVAASNTTLTLLGAYTGKGRLAQGGQTFDTVSGANVKGVLSGNTNLDEFVNIGDVGTVATFYNPTYVIDATHPARRWQDGDFSGDGIVNIGDVGELATHYAGNTIVDAQWTTHGTVAPGGGAGAGLSGGAVPEPATIVMLALGGLGVLGFKRRHAG